MSYGCFFIVTTVVRRRVSGIPIGDPVREPCLYRRLSNGDCEFVEGSVAVGVHDG